MDQFIVAIYGDPPPAKRANLERAIILASDELLMGQVDQRVVRSVVQDLNAGPIPFSTHDLALSAAMNILKNPAYRPLLYKAQLDVRVKMAEWLEDKLVAPLLVQSFDSVLYNMSHTGFG